MQKRNFKLYTLNPSTQTMCLFSLETLKYKTEILIEKCHSLSTSNLSLLCLIKKINFALPLTDSIYLFL